MKNRVLSWNGVILVGIPLLFSGCVGSSSSVQPSSALVDGLLPGQFAAGSDETYCDGGAAIGPPGCTPNDNIFGAEQGMQNFLAPLTNNHWTGAITPNDATNATLFENYQSSSDFVLFSGHGNVGNFVFPAQDRLTSWGVGSLSGDSVNTEDCSLGLDPANLEGMPLQGNLKWIFALSSDTTAGPSLADPSGDLDWDADWTPAFVGGNGIGPIGSLHGIYGFWQHANPGVSLCGRTPDVTVGQNEQMGSLFAQDVFNPSGSVSIFSSWLYAALGAGMETGVGIWQDQRTVDDHLTTAGGANNSPIGEPAFYDFSNQKNGVGVQAVSVPAASFIMRPQNLQNEPIDDSTKFQELRQAFDPNSVFADNGVQRTANGSGYRVTHLYASTGAVTYESEVNHNPVGFTQTVAQNEATAYVSGTLGMPSDAVPTDTYALMQYSPKSQSKTVLGYLFEWRHSSNTFGGPVVGGDAIKVLVDDLQTQTTVCTQTEIVQIAPNKVHVVCVQTKTTFTDSPHISFAYREWRSPAGTKLQAPCPPGKVCLQSVGQAGQPSIDAHTASLSLPVGFVVTGYSSGYYTGNGVDPGSTANGATPVWIFTSGTQSLAVNAATGVLIGPV